MEQKGGKYAYTKQMQFFRKCAPKLENRLNSRKSLKMGK